MLQQFPPELRRGTLPSHVVSLDSIQPMHKMRPALIPGKFPVLRARSHASTMTGSAEIVTGPWCGAARWWFGALDCRSFVVGGHEWIAHVMGIHVARFDVWVQLEVAGIASHSLVLHITRGMTVPDALAAIEAMIAVDGEYSH